MVRILEEFPTVRQTFNLVPSMMAQVAEYAAGQARDPFLEMALKPAETLNDGDRAFLLRHSFYSDPDRMIRRYPRYGEIYDAWRGQTVLRRADAAGRAGFPRPPDVVATGLVRRGVSRLRSRGPRLGPARPQFHLRRPAPHGREAARDRQPGDARIPENGRLRADRNLHHALLPPHPAAVVRFRYRQRLPRRRAPAAALPLSPGRPPPARTGARLLRPELRRGARRPVAFGRLGFRRCLHPRLRTGFRMGGHRLRRPQPHALPLHSHRGPLPPLSLAPGQAIAGRHLPRPFHERSDRLRLFQNGRRRGRRRFPAAHPRELLRAPGQRPRRPGSHHSRRRKRLGVLRPQRPPVPPRALPPHFRRRPLQRRHRERRARGCSSPSRSITSSRGRGSTPISTSGSAPKRTTTPGPSSCAPARLTIPPSTSPRSGATWPSRSCSSPRAATGAGGTVPNTIPPTAWISTSSTAATSPTFTVS